MPKVSVIIPVYNVEKYIENCLDSIMRQTFQEFEVIVINDGSTDETLSICKQYIGKIPNLKIISKANEGQAVARNIGTQKANGDYICYIDADDWVSTEFLEILYHNAIKHNADIIQCNHFYAYDNYVMVQSKKIKITKNNVIQLNTEDAIKELIMHNIIQNFPWGKLIRRKIAQNSPLPNIKNFEDAYWFHKIIHNSSNYIIIKPILYYYRQRIGSKTASFGKTSLLLLDGAECRLNFITNNYPQLSNLMIKSYIKTFLTLYYNAFCDSSLIHEYKKRRSCFLKKYKRNFSDTKLSIFKFKILSSSRFMILCYNIANRIFDRLNFFDRMTILNYDQAYQYEN